MLCVRGKTKNNIHMCVCAAARDSTYVYLTISGCRLDAISPVRMLYECFDDVINAYAVIPLSAINIIITFKEHQLCTLCAGNLIKN